MNSYDSDGKKCKEAFFECGQFFEVGDKCFHVVLGFMGLLHPDFYY